MKKCNNCSSVDLILFTHYYMGILNSKPIFFRVLNHMAISAEPLFNSHLS